MGGEILAILEEEKRKFFGFLDSILKQNSTETILEDTKKEGELKKEGGDRDMADEKKLEEMSHMEKNTDPNKKYLSDKEVEQYAKDNKMTYQEACSVLVKEGKIE